MRFLVLMIPAVYQQANGGTLGPKFIPDAEMMAEMGRFNDELRRAGAIIAIDGLQPLTAGARLTFSGGQATVADGATVHSSDIVGGYWLLEATSKQQVIDWMKRCPAQNGDTIEIRQVAELSDFPPEVRAAAAGNP